MNISNLIILGAGHFGRNALIKCSKSYPHCRITIVDQNETALKNCAQEILCKTVCGDVITYLNSLPKTTSDLQSSWIIPSAPIHVAFEWLKSNHAKPVQKSEIPNKLLAHLPNAIAGDIGTVYMSYATFRCPDNCPEPIDYCYVTNKPRPISLFEALEKLQFNNFTSIVLQSRQILPGIGGFQFRDLMTLLARTESSETPILLTTACRCHGVMNAFEFRHASYSS